MKASNGNTPDSDFYDNANSYALLPLIRKPTRIATQNFQDSTTESISIIDNILTNCLSNPHSGIFAVQISDHMPIFALFKNFFCNENKIRKISFRQCNELNLNNLYFQFGNSINFDELVAHNVDELI